MFYVSARIEIQGFLPDASVGSLSKSLTADWQITTWSVPPVVYPHVMRLDISIQINSAGPDCKRRLAMCLQDLSAKFAGIIFGLTNGLSGIVESLSIYGTGLILDSHHSWPLVFEIVASVSIAGGVFYILFASSKQQSW